jgi:glycosyltransferase involved in cell wall biosynthesis
MRKLLFVSQRPFYPDSSGGGQHSALYLFKGLRKLGWQIEVICARDIKSPYFWPSIQKSLINFQLPFSVIRDEDFGYTTWRMITKFTNNQQWLGFLDKRIHQFKPDVVLGHCHPECILLNHAAQKGIPSIYFARCTDHFEDGSRVADGIEILANSHFAASYISEVNNRNVEVILPFVELDQYRIKQRQRQYISFVNPVPYKGLQVAVEAARQLPQEKFLFVKGKSVAFAQRQDELLRPARALPNVEIWEHQQDMRKVYEVSDILLVPSQYNETFGRVIVEAQVNSIPVVASKVGGIPFALGEGGILVDPMDNIQGYVEAIQKLRSDEIFYGEKSKLAYLNSQRPEYNPEFQVEQFVRIVEKQLQTKQPSLVSFK